MFNARLKQIDEFLDTVDENFLDYVGEKKDTELTKVLNRLTKEKAITVRLGKDTTDINKSFMAVSLIMEKRSILEALRDHEKSILAEQELDPELSELGGHTLV